MKNIKKVKHKESQHKTAQPQKQLVIDKHPWHKTSVLNYLGQYFHLLASNSSRSFLSSPHHVYVPLTSNSAVKLATPAALLAVQVYAPPWPGPTELIVSMLALSPNMAVRMPTA
jgi:hypothetical protein